LLRPDLPYDWLTIPLEAIPDQGLNLEGVRVSQHQARRPGVPNPPIEAPVSKCTAAVLDLVCERRCVCSLALGC